MFLTPLLSCNRHVTAKFYLFTQEVRFLPLLALSRPGWQRLKSGVGTNFPADLRQYFQRSGRFVSGPRHPAAAESGRERINGNS